MPYTRDGSSASFLRLSIPGESVPVRCPPAAQQLERERERLHALLLSHSRPSPSPSSSPDGAGTNNDGRDGVPPRPPATHHSASPSSYPSDPRVVVDGGGGGGVWGAVIRAASASHSRSRGSSSRRSSVTTRTDEPACRAASSPSPPGSCARTASPESRGSHSVDAVVAAAEAAQSVGGRRASSDDKGRGERDGEATVPGARRSGLVSSLRWPTTASLTRSLLVAEERKKRQERSTAHLASKRAATGRGRGGGERPVGGRLPLPREQRRHSPPQQQRRDEGGVYAINASQASLSCSEENRSALADSEVDAAVGACWGELQRVERALDAVAHEPHRGSARDKASKTVVRELMALQQQLLSALDQLLPAEGDDADASASQDSQSSSQPSWPAAPKRCVRVASSLSAYHHHHHHHGPPPPLPPSPLLSPLPPRRAATPRGAVRLNRSQLLRREANERYLQRDPNTHALHAERMAAAYLTHSRRSLAARGAEDDRAKKAYSARGGGRTRAQGSTPLGRRDAARPSAASLSQLSSSSVLGCERRQGNQHRKGRYAGWFSPVEGATPEKAQPLSSLPPSQRGATPREGVDDQRRPDADNGSAGSPPRWPIMRRPAVRLWERGPSSPVFPERPSFLDDSEGDEEPLSNAAGREDDGHRTITTNTNTTPPPPPPPSSHRLRRGPSAGAFAISTQQGYFSSLVGTRHLSPTEAAPPPLVFPTGQGGGRPAREASMTAPPTLREAANAVNGQHPVCRSASSSSSLLSSLRLPTAPAATGGVRRTGQSEEDHHLTVNGTYSLRQVVAELSLLSGLHGG